MAEVTFQLVQLFGTNDLLTIVGIKSIEDYQNSFGDIDTLRPSYLRKVIRNHPLASGLELDTPEGLKEAITRSKKLYVMNDIFKFLTDKANADTNKARQDYLSKGTIPDFPSLKFLRENAFKESTSGFTVPEFETVAAQLKEAYQIQMKKIKEMQDTFVE